MKVLIEINDIRWLIKYVKAFMDWDALGNFLTVADVHKFKELKERYKELWI